MKRAAALPLVLLGSALLAFAVRAQTPGADSPKTTLQTLEAMRVENITLIQRQNALLLKLDELQKEAAQLRFLAKRG